MRPTSEFKIVSSATFSPTHCFACLTHGGPFVDTEVDIPAYGHFYLCVSCMGQMARLAGYADPVAVARMKETIEQLQDSYADARAEADELVKKRSVTTEQLLRVLRSEGVLDAVA